VLTVAAPVAALVLFTIARRLPLLLHSRLIDDEVNYAVVARELLQGGRLYADIVERRPPLTMWVYEAVFGVAGPSNWFALHVAAVVWVLLTLAALYALGSALFGRRAGFFAAALYSAFQPWWFWGDLAFNGEVLMNLPVATAYALLLGGRQSGGIVRAGVAGASIGAAALLKQPAAITIVPLVYLAGIHPGMGARDWRITPGVIALVAGAALPAGLVCAWASAHGLLSEMLYWSILDHDVPHVFWSQGGERTATFLLVGWPLVVAAIRTTIDSGLWRGREEVRDALVGLLAAAGIGAVASGRFFPHYYIALFPPLVVLASPAVDRLLSGAGSTIRRPLRVAVAAWLIGAVVVATALQWRRGVAESGPSAAGEYLRQHAPAGTRTFVWGRQPEIYLDGRVRPASRYIDTFALTGRFFGPALPGVDTSAHVRPRAWADLQSDFAAHPPAFIVDTQIAARDSYPVAEFPVLDRIIHRDYELAARVAGARIYRLIPSGRRPDERLIDD
jgi:4-amino-4-deoxy-L-arabinose transferase-like glycosyltransferase